MKLSIVLMNSIFMVTSSDSYIAGWSIQFTGAKCCLTSMNGDRSEESGDTMELFNSKKMIDHYSST